MVVLSVIIFAILGELYTERGSMLSTAIFVYAATSPINGYAGGGLYARMGGRVWIKQMVLSAFMLPLMVCGTAFFINFIAMYYHASRAIPFGSMVCNCILKLDYSYSSCIQFTCQLCAGCGDMYLHICDITVDAGRYHSRP